MRADSLDVDYWSTDYSLHTGVTGRGHVGYGSGHTEAAMSDPKKALFDQVMNRRQPIAKELQMASWPTIDEDSNEFRAICRQYRKRTGKRVVLGEYAGYDKKSDMILMTMPDWTIQCMDHFTNKYGYEKGLRIYLNLVYFFLDEETNKE